VLGIDLSENTLAEVEALLKKEGLREWVALMCGDAEHLPYKDPPVDGVFMSFTLELFATLEQPRVLGEGRRVLRPRVRLVDVSISKDGKAGLAFEAFEWTHRHFPNLMDGRPIYVACVMEAAGIEVREMRKEMMWVPVEIVLGVKA
jgi:ubiquinone/menaquinone biosynthesis C-methylase UbiE